METAHEFNHYDLGTTNLLIVTYLISMVSTILFYYGFIVIGNELNNNLLLVSSLIIIVTTIFYYIHELYTINLSETDEDLFGLSILMLFGFSGIFFGVGLYKLRDTLGKFASIAGSLEIIIGISFVVIILFFIGIILSIPAVIFEILLLLKVSELPEFKSIPDISLNAQNTQDK